jgi:two-component system, LytTR family, response regulator LytT
VTLSCIAVDDEPLALGLVSSFIEKTPFLRLAGRYGSAVAALKAIHEQPLDLIFLDIQMPDLTGLELARVLNRSAQPRPCLIFTTAYDQYALEGYKVDALDYLLKPFNYEEFLRAANKALSHSQLQQQARQISPPPIEATPAVAPPAPTPDMADEYLFLKVEYQLVRVTLSDITHIEGLKDYVKVFRLSDPKPLLSLTSLKALEEKLPAHRFMRIHRSFIVSLDRITALTRNNVQIGTVTISVSDQYKEPFSQFLNKWL